MRRRWLGGLVLVIALLAAVTVPVVVDGRRVVGHAQAQRFPDAPAAGTCLLDAGPAGQARPQSLPLDGLTFGSCDGPIRGQVVGVLDAPQELVGSRRDPCFRAAATAAGLQYVGRRPTLPEAPRTDNVSWAPFLGFTITRIEPGEQARRGGQHWIACLAAPHAGGVYTGRLDGVYTAERSLPAAFATCWAAQTGGTAGAVSGVDLDSTATLLPCDAPHGAELLAVARVGDRSLTSREEMRAGCAAMAAAMLRMSDPTAGGQLSVVLDPVSSDGASRPTDPWTLNCFVVATGDRQLTDSVVGWGERPLPLAG